MAFISTVPQDQATGDVAAMYDENVRKNGFLPNYVPLFSHRPQVMAAWGQLLGSITRPMDKRRYELITLAAARALTSSYCMLAHGSVLLQFYAGEQLEQIANDYRAADLTPAEIGMMAFAEQIRAMPRQLRKTTWRSYENWVSRTGRSSTLPPPLRPAAFSQSCWTPLALRPTASTWTWTTTYRRS